jgi:hypothetical protein
MDTANEQLDEWVDLVADRFEAAWKGGSRPIVGDFLGQEEPGRRRAVIAELVKIDLHYRFRIGERPGLDEYVSRMHFARRKPPANWVPIARPIESPSASPSTACADFNMQWKRSPAAIRTTGHRPRFAPSWPWPITV